VLVTRTVLYTLFSLHLIPRHNGTPSRDSDSDAQQPSLNVRIYALGGTLKVEGLQNLALAKLSRACAIFWSSDDFAELAVTILVCDMEEWRNHLLMKIMFEMIAEHKEFGCEKLGERAVQRFGRAGEGIPR
jgi:hypothetical protein